MPRLTVRPLTASDTAIAAGLLAQRHRRDRARLPMLAAGLEQPVGCEKLIAALVNNPRASGFVAERDGRAVGFVFGEQNLLPPEHFASQFIPPHSISIGVEAHAVADGEDAVEIYRALYRPLSEEWVGGGFFTQRWNIVPGDANVAEAVVSLGFGRHSVAATRDTAVPVEAGHFADIEVHRAGAEDIEVVTRLSDHLMMFHSRAPIFWPFLRTTDAAARGLNLGELESGKTPYWVGYLNGQPAGMQSFLKPGFTPPVVEPASDIYLFDGVVDENARGGGIGAALLRHSMRWAAENGFRTCTLHFASQNYSGGPFWLGHGFVPVEHTMERRIDERVAWANG